MVSESWVGGDIAGLHGMASIMQGAPAEMRDVVHVLSTKVDDLVNAAGWSGDAADSFRKAWTADSITAGSLAEVVDSVGGIIGDLASNLEKVDNALYDAAYAASKQGIQVGPRGEPPTMATSARPSPQEAATVTALQTYVQEYDSAQQLAEGFRLDAAQKLSDVYDEIRFDPGLRNKPDQWVTIGDYLRGLYAIPDERNRAATAKIPQQIRDMQDRIKRVRADLKAVKVKYAAKGLKLPSGNPDSVAHKQVFSELNELKTKLQAAEKGEGDLPLGKALNTKLADVAKLGKIGSALPDFLKFTKEIPVVDIVAAGLSAGFQTKEDIEKGWSPAHAVSVDYGAAATGLAAGAGITALAATAPIDVPVLLVAGVGGAVAVGVGDLVYQGFHEHWAEDIHDHGVVGGVLTGTWNMITNTGKDFEKMGEGVWNGARSLWHSVLG